MTECGWCGQPTEPGRCGNCHRDPALPWVQRGVDPPVIDPRDALRKRLHVAVTELEQQGHRATAERIAEHLDVSPRTVRRWQQMAGS